MKRSKQANRIAIGRHETLSWNWRHGKVEKRDNANPAQWGCWKSCLALIGMNVSQANLNLPKRYGSYQASSRVGRQPGNFPSRNFQKQFESAKTFLVVSWNNKLQSFCPPQKLSAGYGPGSYSITVINYKLFRQTNGIMIMHISTKS